MKVRLIPGKAVRADHSAIERTVLACNEVSGADGMLVGVCNESALVYLEVRTATDTEFIQVVSCLESLGFSDVSAMHPERNRYHSVMCIV